MKWLEQYKGTEAAREAEQQFREERELRRQQILSDCWQGSRSQSSRTMETAEATEVAEATTKEAAKGAAEAAIKI